MKVIELGGGANPKYRPNADCRMIEGSVDVVCDFEKPLPLPACEYDFVYSAFVLEHVSWRNSKQFVKEIYRILRPSGRTLIITANLLEQCKVVANSQVWDENFSCMIFGNQDFGENSHKNGFSPEYAVKIFKEAGFREVNVAPLPQCNTDMVINAVK